MAAMKGAWAGKVPGEAAAARRRVKFTVHHSQSAPLARELLRGHRGREVHSLAILPIVRLIWRFRYPSTAERHAAGTKSLYPGR